MHEILSFLGGGEALVDELVLIVDEVLVLLEVVLFSTEEFVELTQP